HEHAVDATADDLGRATAVRGHDRGAGSHRLEQHSAARLGVGGEDEDVEPTHHGGDVAAITDEPNPVLAARVLHDAVKRVGAPRVLVEQRIAHDDEVRV